MIAMDCETPDSIKSMKQSRWIFLYLELNVSCVFSVYVFFDGFCVKS